MPSTMVSSWAFGLLNAGLAGVAGFSLAQALTRVPRLRVRRRACNIRVENMALTRLGCSSL